MRTIRAGLVVATIASACGSAHRVGDVPAVDGGPTTTDRDGAMIGGDGATGECDPGLLCLEVNRLGTGAVRQGVIAIVWFQLDDDGPDPEPVLAFEVATSRDTGWARTDILLSAVAPPPEPVRWCPRDCEDESICPCTGNPQVTIGAVVVFEDPDLDGSLSPAEIAGGTSVIGVGWVVVANANDRYVPAPAPFNQIFVEGVLAGTAAYRVTDADSTGRNDLAIPPVADTFVLHMCTDDMTVCELPSVDLL